MTEHTYRVETYRDGGFIIVSAVDSIPSTENPRGVFECYIADWHPTTKLGLKWALWRAERAIERQKRLIAKAEQLVP